MKAKVSTIAALIEAFPETTLRKQIKAAFKQTGPEVMDLSPQAYWDAHESRLKFLTKIENKNSRSAYKCQILKALRWAIDEGIVKPSGSEGISSLGYPSYGDIAAGIDAQEPAFKTAWNAFVRYASSRNLRLDELDKTEVDMFRKWLQTQVYDARRSWNVFAVQWDIAANAGILPPMGLSPEPTKKRHSYALSPDELPNHLQEELSTAVARQSKQLLGDRFGRREIGDSTVKLRTAIFLRYVGWRERNGICLASRKSLSELITKEELIAYLLYTNNGRPIDDMGEYQESILINLSQFVRHGLLCYDKGDIISELWSFYRHSFFSQREDFKQAVPLDDVYYIISTLLDMANDCTLSSRDRILLIRDAVVIILLASFGFRRDILLRLEIGTTFRESQHNGQPTYLIDLAKEITKPKLRDGYYQIICQFYTLISF